jgi:eukaryotic-like serine/threonine-protein kinase
MIDVGSTVGNYVVRSLLGEGGMGRVWLAEHPLIGRKMAVKVIHPDFARNPEALSRFFTEALAATRIGHSAIVDIVDYGQTAEGEGYFVMELLTGDSLHQAMAKRRFTIPEIVEIGYQLADGVAAAHTAGILHRDLKPENIYVLPRSNGIQVKILDFGLAKLTAGDTEVGHKTRLGAVMGTPCYMAPEQCAGHGNLDGRVDVYAVGVILYEMITGVRPFDGDNFTQILLKHMMEPPPPIAPLAPECPEWLDQTVMQLLAKDVASRPQMQDLATQLGTIAQSQAPRPISTPGGVARPGSYLGPRPASVQGVQGLKTPTTLGLGAGEPTVKEPIPATRPRSKAPIFIAAATVIAIGAGIAALTLRGSAAKPAPTPIAAKPVDPPPPVVVPDLKLPEVATVVPDAAPTAPTTITLQLESDPPGAAVLLDGKQVGVTPYAHETAPGDAPLRFTFEKAGHEPRTKDITPREGQVVSVALARLPDDKKGTDRRRDRDRKRPPKETPVDDDLLAPK